MGDNLGPTFDELSARRIYPNFSRMRDLMRAQLGGFVGSAAGPNPPETVRKYRTEMKMWMMNFLAAMLGMPV